MLWQKTEKRPLVSAAINGDSPSDNRYPSAQRSMPRTLICSLRPTSKYAHLLHSSPFFATNVRAGYQEPLQTPSIKPHEIWIAANMSGTQENAGLVASRPTPCAKRKCSDTFNNLPSYNQNNNNPPIMADLQYCRTLPTLPLSLRGNTRQSLFLDNPSCLHSVARQWRVKGLSGLSQCQRSSSRN